MCVKELVEQGAKVDEPDTVRTISVAMGDAVDAGLLRRPVECGDRTVHGCEQRILVTCSVLGVGGSRQHGSDR